MLAPGCSEAVDLAHAYGIQCLRLDAGRQAIIGKKIIMNHKDFPIYAMATSIQLLPHALKECLARENDIVAPEDIAEPPALPVAVTKPLKDLATQFPPAFKFNEPDFEIEVSERSGAAKSNTFAASFDVAFVIDKTGSMNSYIKACKQWSLDTAQTILSKMAENNVQVSLRMAVVFYSGYCCNCGPQPIVYGFGTPAEISRETAMEKTEGGCGSSADVWSGLRRAVDLDWRDSAQKMIFLIGDEPGHNQPALWVNDSSTKVMEISATRNPCGKTILRDMKAKSIQFVGPNITSQTNTMNKVFASLYDGPGFEYQVRNLSSSYNPDEFKELMYDLVKSQLHNYVL